LKSGRPSDMHGLDETRSVLLRNVPTVVRTPEALTGLLTYPTSRRGATCVPFLFRSKGSHYCIPELRIFFFSISADFPVEL